MPSTTIDRVTGLSTSVAVKAPVRLATTANRTLSSLTSVDGIVPSEGDRILVKSQTNSAENGIYYASALGWDRTEDCDSGDDLVSGTVVFVRSGTTNGNNWFQATVATTPPVIGTTAITWAQTYVSFTVVSAASEAAQGIAELATQAEVTARTDDARIVTPLKLATDWTNRLASQAEAEAGTDNTKWLTPLRASQEIAARSISFSAHKNGTNQTSITSATPTKLTFGTEEWDVGGYYDAANSKFLPLVAGKYQINAAAFFLNSGGNIVDQAQYQIAIYKNGSQWKWGNCLTASGTSGLAPTISCIVDMNGSTDYVEVYCYGGGAGAKTIDGTSYLTWFQGTRLP